MGSWQDLLQTRRRCLLAAAEKYGSLGCALIHVGPAELARLDSLPEMYGNLLRVEEYQTPEGGTRRVLLRQRDDWPEFRRLAEEAGKILADAPAGSLPVPAGVLSTRWDFPRWVEAVFHVAAPARKLWADKMTFPRDAAKLQGLKAAWFGNREYLSAWADTLPDFWLADLPCIYRASVDVIDRLTAAAVAPPVPEAVEEGPVEPDGFIWQGVTYRGLARKPFFAVRYLWAESNKAARSDDLAEPVWEDPAGLPDEEAVRGLRKEINGFFRAHGIAWHAAVKNQCLALCSGPPREGKAKPKAKRNRKTARKRAR